LFTVVYRKRTSSLRFNLNWIASCNHICWIFRSLICYLRY
jgi:hypothetical protein